MSRPKIETYFHKYPVQAKPLNLIVIAKSCNKSLSVLTVWFNTVCLLRLGMAHTTVPVFRQRSAQQ